MNATELSLRREIASLRKQIEKVKEVLELLLEAVDIPSVTAAKSAFLDIDEES